jgi:hypothetical protein
LLQYLEQVLGLGRAGGGQDEGDLLRAGAALAVVAGLDALLPLVLQRWPTDGAPWAEAMLRQHPRRSGARSTGC